MDSTQKPSKNSNPVLPFKPAELAKWQNGEWRIVFYCLDHKSGKLKRHTRRVPPITGIKKREAYARKMIGKINDKIENGQYPQYENANPGAFNSLISVFETYINRLKKSVIDGEKRKATLISYESYIRVFKKWMDEFGKNDLMTIQFDRQLLQEFLDYIHYDRSNSATTHNNYLTFFSAFSTYLIDRKIIFENPTTAIPKKKTTQKARKAIPQEIRIKAFEYFEKHNIPYALICKLMYYELMRRTEMAKLKVKDIDFKNEMITIRPEVSKNNKKQYITIVDPVKEELKSHIENADPDCYVFSEKFLPGKTMINPKRMSYPWEKMKTTLSLPDEYQFYSLKDSGITDLLNAGVPAIHVRDHARHHDIAVTQKYASKGEAVSKDKLRFA